MSLIMHSTNIDLTNQIPPFLMKAALYVEKLLMENGFEVYLVGGSVRDLILNKKISDLDFTTNAHPDQIKKIFPKTIPVGEEFGTILVLYHRHPVEVTTYRSDGIYKDGRRPESVNFGHSLKEDVMRRDFTINGMAYHVSRKILIDYVGGRKDIEARIIRTIGDPMERFREDGLRPIRGCRLMANLGFKFDPETESAINRNIEIIGKVAPERFYDEWKKTLKIRKKQDFWNALKNSGIFSVFFPEFQRLNSVEETWNNLMQAIEHSMPQTMDIYVAHFFYSEFCNDRQYILSNSEAIKKLMNDFFKRNRFPVKVQKNCAYLLLSPLLLTLDNWNASENNFSQIKKALSKIQYPDWSIHLRFIKEILYRYHKNISPDHPKALEYHSVMNQIIQTIRDYRRGKYILYLNELGINGNDLLKLGFHGKQIGNLLDIALQYIIINPEKNNFDDLIKIVQKHS